MTESQLTRKELKKIKARWPDAFLWKINERISSGKPDALLVNGAGRTEAVWIEFKRCLSMKTDPLTMLSPLQHHTLVQLTRQRQKCYVVAFMPDKTQRLFFPYRDGTGGVSFAASASNSLMHLLEREIWPS